MRIAILLCPIVICVGALIPTVGADELLHRFEGDVFPYHAMPAWTTGGSGMCQTPCSEALEDGHFVLRWPIAGDIANYFHRVAEPPNVAPSSLWIEWIFKSNHPLGPLFDSCDGRFSVKYGGMHDVVYMYGNAAITFGGIAFVTGLDLDSFHSYRFESLDGVNYWISVDGSIFIVDSENQPNGYHTLQFSGMGGCIGDQIPNMENAWDFVRYGTISYGEAVVDSDPPLGDVSAMDYPDRTRFTVTYDSPNYVYVDEISVAVEDFSGVTPVAPISYPMVLQTRRLDNGPPEVVEIVLDKPIPHAAVTTFTLTDGVATNVIEYTLSPADADGDGLATLADFAHFQNCFRPGPPSSFCRTFDLSRNGSIDLTDHTLAQPFLTNP